MKSALFYLLALLTLLVGVQQAAAQGTSFAYQGGLNTSNAPASGTFDFVFELYNSSQSGSQVGAAETNIAVAVSEGLFTTTLDFGSEPWNGQSLWLQILVRINGTGAFSLLTPRQPMTSSPYAIQSLNAATAATASTATTASNVTGNIADSQLPADVPLLDGTNFFGGTNTFAGVVVATNTSNTFNGTFAGNLNGGATTAVTASNFSGSLGGDVTGTQDATTVASIGGQSAASVAAGASAANAATSTNIPGTIVSRDASGNFAAGAIAANFLSGNGGAVTNLSPANIAAGTAAINISGNAATALSASNVTGNIADFQLSTNVPLLDATNGFTGTNTFAGAVVATNTNNIFNGAFTGILSGDATVAITASNFSGSLSGDVTGTQGATTVASVGGQSAASVAGGSIAANAATSTNIPGTIVMRDGSGNFAAGAITAGSLSGDGGALTNLNPANLDGGTAAINISGNAATALSASNVTGNIADFQLSTNVPLLNGTNSFTGTNIFAGVTIATNVNNIFTGAFAGSLIGNATTATSATTATTAGSAATAGTANNFTGSLLGQVVGTQGATTVVSVGGQSAANVASGAGAANAATSADTPSTIVKRDATGGFSAGTLNATTVNAAFRGNGSALTNLNASQLTFSGDGNIDIGTTAAAGDNDTLRIGAPGTQTNAFVAGIYGATAASGVPVYVTSSNQLGTLTSSRKYKEDIQTMNDASDALLALHPVTFRYKPEIDPCGIPQFGLVAEEVEEVDRDLVAHDAQGRPYTVRYEAVNAMLLNEFLKEHRKVEVQSAKIDELTQRLDRLEKALSQTADGAENRK